jgi:hypothetical protein
LPALVPPTAADKSNGGHTKQQKKEKEKEKIRRRQKKPPGKAIRSDEIRVARLSGLNHRVTGSVRPSGRKSRIFSMNLTEKNNKHPIESGRVEIIDEMSAEFALGAARTNAIYRRFGQLRVGWTGQICATSSLERCETI